MRASLLLVIVFSIQSTFAQKHPLSKSDSGMVLQSLEKYEYLFQKNDLRSASGALNDAAFIYWNNNHYQEAVDYYERSYALNEQVSNENGMAMINNNLGMLYADLGQYEKSLAAFEKTLAARRSNKESVGIISALVNMSVVLNNLSKYSESIEKLLEALDLARELYDKNQMRSVYGMLSETYEKKGDIDQSLKYFRLYKSFHEEIQREEIEEVNQELEAEKLQKQLVEVEKTKKENELLKKELEIFQQDQIILEIDSINQELYADLTKNDVIIRLLEKEKELAKFETNTIELENNQLQEEKSNLRIILTIIILAVLIISVLISVNTNNIRRHAKKLEEKNQSIEKQRQELKKANELKNRIFSIISHDLRSPLSSLQRLFGMIDSKDMDDYLVEALNSVEAQLTNSATLMDNLLSWSRSQIKNSEPVIQKVGVRDLVEENFYLLHNHADNKEIKLENNVSEADFINTDKVMINIVIRNLIQNAIKFTSPGGLVAVNFEFDKKNTLIKVRDTGIGMNTNQIANLFDIDTTRKSIGTADEKGSGLGLVLCKELIERIDGLIEVNSTPGNGSEFMLKF